MLQCDLIHRREPSIQSHSGNPTGFYFFVVKPMQINAVGNHGRKLFVLQPSVESQAACNMTSQLIDAWDRHEPWRVSSHDFWVHRSTCDVVRATWTPPPRLPVSSTGSTPIDMLWLAPPFIHVLLGFPLRFFWPAVTAVIGVSGYRGRFFLFLLTHVSSQRLNVCELNHIRDWTNCAVGSPT